MSKKDQIVDEILDAPSGVPMTSEFETLSEPTRRYLVRKDWNYVETIEGEKVQFRFILNLDSVLSQIYIDCFEGSRRLGVFAYAPIKVPEEFRLPVIEYLTRVNHLLFSSKYDCDLRDGELRVTVVATLKETSCTENLVSSMISFAQRSLDKHLPGVLMIMHGALSAQEAWDANAELRES
jgi:hypothetical protein